MRRDRSRLGHCISQQRNEQVFSESRCRLVANGLPYAHVSVSFVYFIEMAREVDEDSKFVFVRQLN